jgi:hypothetical protein
VLPPLSRAVNPEIELISPTTQSRVKSNQLIDHHHGNLYERCDSRGEKHAEGVIQT